MSRRPDAVKVAAAFHKMAVEYDKHILVQKRVVEQLAESIELHMKRVPEKILDVGTGTGALLERLHLCYRDADLTGVDIAFNMCQRTQQKMGAICRTVNADAAYLPFRNETFDLIVSASALQWVGNLSAVLMELRRVVRSGGSISLAFFCDGTLNELQHCYRDAVSLFNRDNGQIISRLHSFWTVEDVQTIVNNMDFERAVVTVETEVDWYDDLYSLLRSIKNIGAGTVSGGSVSGLGWRGILQLASRLYQERYGVNSRIPASYKVLHLNANLR